MKPWIVWVGVGWGIKEAVCVDIRFAPVAGERAPPQSCDNLPRDEVRICTVAFELPGSD
jgi:hypothetical protein